MFNHLWTRRNQRRLALPKAHEAILTLACFGPEGIGHPIGVDPHLGGSQKLLLRTLFAANPHVVDELGSHKGNASLCSLTVFRKRPVSSRTRGDRPALVR